MKANHFLTVLILATLVVISGLGPSNPPISTAAQAAEEARTTRQGAWLDSLVFTGQDDPGQAIEQLQHNELDVYADNLADPTLYQTVLEDPNLTHSIAYGNYNELTFNPSGPTFNDGRLNPFSNAKIRQAMNWLVDRNKVAQEIFGGMATPLYTTLLPVSADYQRYQSAIEAIEATYAYSLTQAETAIATEMLGMGANLVDDTWFYNSEPVTVTFIIRVEDFRLNIGNYVSDQLEAIGFTVDRQYKTRDEASLIWNYGNPAEGQWHIYTGGWVSTSISRDDGANFGYFYTSRGSSTPLGQAYQPTPQFEEVCNRLWVNDFSTLSERAALFEQALTMAMNDSGPGTQGAGSLRVWLVDNTSFAPRRSGTTVAADLAGGVILADLFPYIARFDGQEGGILRVAQSELLVNPWNPVAGSADIFDIMPQRATQDRGLIIDPNTGLFWPLRIKSADVVVKEGLPISKTLDWLTLTTVPAITVPGDAWVDWDAAGQVFITASEKFTETQTANSKVTVHYPADFFTTVKWHDGSPVSMGDIVMNMILSFDRAKPGSPIYDESAVGPLDGYLSHFKGVKIESTNPLVITTYDDRFYLDAELMIQTWFPARWSYATFPAPWHTLATAIRAEAAGEIAFSTDKAGALGVPWTNFIGGQSLDILENWMNQSASQHYIPYSPTLGFFVTLAEAESRWTALQTWYTARHHFWLGSGPFYLEQVTYNPRSITLAHFADYPDLAGRWDEFATPAPPQIVINHPSGAPGSYFNINGAGFPPNSTAFIVINGNLLGKLPVDDSGAIAFTLSTNSAEVGIYHLRVSVNPSAGVRFMLKPNMPVWEKEGTLTEIPLPGGLAVPFHSSLMPVVFRN